MKLDVKAFALALAVLTGLGLFLLTWWVIAWHGVSLEPTALGRIYPGYRLTPLGSVIALVWGALSGLIGGFLFAWLYNQLVGSTPT